MQAKTVFNVLSVEQREAVLAKYKQLTMPQHNGGAYLSPNEIKETLNFILTQAMGRSINMAANSQNALLNMLEGA